MNAVFHSLSSYPTNRPVEGFAEITISKSYTYGFFGPKSVSMSKTVHVYTIVLVRICLIYHYFHYLPTLTTTTTTAAAFISIIIT